MRKIVILLVLIGLVSCSVDKTTKVTIVDSTSTDTTFIDTTIVK